MNAAGPSRLARHAPGVRGRARDRRAAGSALVLAACWTAATALAQAAPAQPSAADPVAGGGSQEQAMQRYQQGLAHYDAGDPERALSELSAAYELSRNYQLLFNIAQLHYQLGHFARARESLQLYLQQGGARIDAERRQLVLRQLQALEQRTALLIVELDGAPAVLEVEGRSVVASGAQQALVVDPGELHLVARRAGQHIERRVRAEPAQVLRLALCFGAPQPATPLLRRAELWSFAAAGLLGAGAIATTVATASASQRYAELRARLGSGSVAATRQQLDRQRTRVRSWAAASDALALASLTAAGLGLYWTLAEDPQQGAARVALGPGGVQLEASF